ncbi:hypothetical protein M1Z66_002087 [Clostridium perfringens]
MKENNYENKMFRMIFVIENVEEWKKENQKNKDNNNEGEGDLLPSERRRDYKRLKKVSDFFENFEYGFNNSNNIFFKESLKAKKNDKGKFEFSIESAIFYICICENLKTKFFKKFLKQEYSTEVEYKEWKDKMFERLKNLRVLYEENNPRFKWKEFQLKVESIIFEFDLINRRYMSVENQLFDVLVKFLAFSEEDRNKIYYDCMRPRIEYINNSINKKIKSLKKYKNSKEKDKKYYEKKDKFEMFELRLNDYLGKYDCKHQLSLNDSIVNMLKEITGK